MWTGSDIEIHRAPVIGESVSVERSVTAVVEKTGRRGAFALVTVGTMLRVNSQPAVTESVTLAYLPANPSAATDSIPMLEPAQPRIASWLRREDAWCWRMQPDPVVLMWFSALTANPHRIHYDRSYARYVEGHPDLLVQGPLMALVLAEVGRRERPDATVMNVSCRARRPLTVGTAARTRLTSPPDSETMQVELVPGLPDDTGQAAYMTGEVRYG
jgi:3-methylfumaryl-CoA hydratase